MKIRSRSIRFGLMVSAASFAAVASYAAAPPAGEKIGNQASATYVNAAGDTISVTSNKVETTVQQVAGLTLVTPNTEDAAPGGKVFLPHVVTNDGNGTDTFDLTAVDANTGTIAFTNITIFPDANFDGVADSTTAISITPAIAAGESYGIVIEATVPNSANAGDQETIDVDATSQFDNSVTAENIDTITVSSGPITEVVKAMTVADTVADGVTGPGDIVTVKLTYSSTGIAAANEMVVTDLLDTAFVYNAGSAVWSDSGTALVDADDADDLTYEQTNGLGQSIDYSVSGQTVAFRLDTVPSGRSGSVTFTATIAAGTPAGQIPNIATQTVEVTPGVPEVFPPSNRASIVVDPVYLATAADAASANYQADPDTATNLNAGEQSSTDADGLNDTVLVTGDVFQGGKVTMEFYVTNHSNTDDTIDVNFSNVDFPAGTTFQLVAEDGATPIVGPIGPLASGAFRKVNIIATLPPSLTPTATTNYTVTLTAQSSQGGPLNVATGEFTGDVLGAAVDLENQGGTGDGPDAVGSPVQITTATDPGVPVIFPMLVQNVGPVSDTYDLTTTVPAGWTVQFQLPNGTPITNTGVIPSGGEQLVYAILTPPAGTPPGNVPFQTAAVSPTTGQGDTLTNQVTVNQIVDVALTSDQSVQAAPGGIADIAHILTNEGNIAITEGALSLGTGFTGFSGTIFHDADNNGTVTTGDTIVDNIDDFGPIPVGGSVSLIHRVQVPSSGAIGLSESNTISVATSLNNDGTAVTDAVAANNTNTDTVTIVSGDMTLVKLQAIDPACNGTIIGSFTQANVSAEPGQCIRYSITAENTGSEAATDVTIRDTVPSFTTFTDCGGTCDPVPGTATTPLSGQTGSIENNHGSVIAGGSVTLEFTVRIDPL